METVCIGWTTFDSAEGAEKFAREVVEAGLAACAQVEGPIRSFYCWEGKRENSQEWRVALKFSTSKAELLAEWIESHHPYQVPQWLAVRADHALPTYVAWVCGNKCE